MAFIVSHTSRIIHSYGTSQCVPYHMLSRASGAPCPCQCFFRAWLTRLPCGVPSHLELRPMWPRRIAPHKHNEQAQDNPLPHRCVCARAHTHTHSAHTNRTTARIKHTRMYTCTQADTHGHYARTYADTHTHTHTHAHTHSYGHLLIRACGLCSPPPPPPCSSPPLPQR